MKVRDIFRKQHISYKHYFTTPTPLNNWLWYVGGRKRFRGIILVTGPYLTANEKLIFILFPGMLTCWNL
jgi:hypothetical protein